VAAVLLAGGVQAGAQPRSAVGPPAAIAAARAAMSDTARGNALRVRLLTVGQGDLVFERYGHNLLWIIDTRTNESIAWNWGVFNFADPGFLTRFLFGNTRYIVDPGNAADELAKYSQDNREVTSQELNLTAGQKAALDAFVRTNALPENKYYQYDYFLDNCSTRLRDALDIVLDGALYKALTARASELTYRSETLRLNQHSNILFMGLDLALGAPSDAPLTPWEYSFVPMRLRDELQGVQVRASDGTMVPLAGPPRLLVEAEREPEPHAIDSRGIRAIIMISGLFLALACIALGLAARRGSRVARAGLVTLGVLVNLVAGLLATLVVFMWAFTLHAFWAWNLHLLIFTPLSLAIAVLLPFARSRPRIRWWVERYHFTLAASAFLVGIGTLVFASRSDAADMLVAWSSAFWLFYLAFGLALFRGLPPAGGQGPDPAAAGMRIAA
jgi:hypothetical protein